ncbi:gamma-glutamyl-gamma-aminobutyrate hydrolase family protein [Nitrincola alkalisediminis]|uniref:gamma-glutamyl-gamma-aminobutyrate hydrolase family protein n=1 Tax=Nitrincola alkalisediminis TaxID=1366656 RepID=UPI001874B609|nr:gamma-glutamyl-gamma-aminobutyrate hydrolase family protein [Nitrincola alkalisediminis]
MNELTTDKKAPTILLIQDLNVTANEHIYHCNANYAQALFQAGALPLLAPFIEDLIPHLIHQSDGILFSGSAPGNGSSSIRTDFEKKLLAAAFDHGIPVLGICHGMQIIGEFLGAKIDDIQDAEVQSLHLPFSQPNRLAHEVQLRHDSWLRAQHDSETAWVNSFHRQSLVGSGNFDVTALSPDGVVEAIEGHLDSLCIGVQWHPEFQLSEFDKNLLRGFVQAAAEYSNCANEYTTTDELK